MKVVLDLNPDSHDDYDDFYDDLKYIAIIGCGESGNMIVTRLSEIGIRGSLTIALNTSGTARKPEFERADEQISIDRILEYEPPYNSNYSARMAKSRVRDLLKGINLCIIIANLDEGPASSAARFAAELARSMGCIVMGIAICPFNQPGDRHQGIFVQKHPEFSTGAHSTWIVDMQDIHSGFALPATQNFPQQMLEIIAQTVKRICDMVSEPSMVCVDHLDVFNALRHPGEIVLARGLGDGKNRVHGAIEDYRKNLIPSLDIAGAKGCLVSLHVGPDITMDELSEIANYFINEYPHADFEWSARPVSGMEGNIEIWAIFTGIGCNVHE